MSTPITPTIGRTVLFVGKDGKIRPGIITHVWSETVINLQVFGKDNNDTEIGVRTSITHVDPAERVQSAGPTWHWMPYQLKVAASEFAALVHTTPANVTGVPDTDTTKVAAVPQMGPRVTPEHIEAMIASGTWSDRKMGEKTTVVWIKLPNGFEVIESSGCVVPENYDHALGVEICKRRIKDKVWLLEGYRLACQIAADRTF